MTEFQLTDKQAAFIAATSDGGEVSIPEIAPTIRLTRSELENLAADLEAKNLMAPTGKPQTYRLTDEGRQLKRLLGGDWNSVVSQASPQFSLTVTSEAGVESREIEALESAIDDAMKDQG